MGEISHVFFKIPHVFFLFDLGVLEMRNNSSATRKSREFIFFQKNIFNRFFHISKMIREKSDGLISSLFIARFVACLILSVKIVVTIKLHEK